MGPPQTRHFYLYWHASYMMKPMSLGILLSFLFSLLDVDYNFPQLILTLFYCPTGLAAYILYCSLYCVVYTFYSTSTYPISNLLICFEQLGFAALKTRTSLAHWFDSSYLLVQRVLYLTIYSALRRAAIFTINDMSSPQMNTSAHVATSQYTPADAINRHDYGIQKNRKQASTGGGRAWSEDEVGCGSMWMRGT